MSREVSDRLVSRFQDIWPEARVQVGEGFSLTWHTHESRKVFQPESSNLWVVDGSVEIAKEVGDAVAVPAHPLHRSALNEWPLDAAGCLVRIWRSGADVEAFVDESGAFPLYYASQGSGFVVGTLAAPVAFAVSAEPDITGVTQFLQNGSMVGSRSLFRGVQRLMPGQRLTFALDKGLRVAETSKAWAGVADGSRASVERDALAQMTSALSTVRPNTMVMASGGWDSRTLLGLRATVEPVMNAYVHGDLGSREVALVRQLIETLRGRLLEMPIDASVLEWDRLSRSFKSSGNAVFPHWHIAGQAAASANFSVVTAGVLGEVIGGHYGPAMIGSSRMRAYRLMLGLVGVRALGRGVGGEAARGLMKSQTTPRMQWYLNPELEDGVSSAARETAEETAVRIDGLIKRGVSNDAQLVEAFITETRGAQYICAQLASCRFGVEIDLPFARRDFFRLASTIPIEMKIHNRLNRLLLSESNPHLLRLPLAATLVPASYPIALQEVSRLVRRTVEGSRWQRTVTGSASLGWVNFDFMRSSAAVMKCIDSLTADLWNKPRLISTVLEFQAGKSWISPHPLYDQLNKIHTVDLELQTAR